MSADLTTGGLVETLKQRIEAAGREYQKERESLRVASRISAETEEGGRIQQLLKILSDEIVARALKGEKALIFAPSGDEVVVTKYFQEQGLHVRAYNVEPTREFNLDDGEHFLGGGRFVRISWEE